jgi:hypothetical protein
LISDSLKSKSGCEASSRNDGAEVSSPDCFDAEGTDGEVTEGEVTEGEVKEGELTEGEVKEGI